MLRRNVDTGTDPVNDLTSVLSLLFSSRAILYGRSNFFSMASVPRSRRDLFRESPPKP